MKLIEKLKNPRQTISDLSGWERIWFVISVIIFLFALAIWWIAIEDPFQNIAYANSQKIAHQNAVKVWEDNEVDCRLNEKSSDKDFERDLQKNYELDQRIQRLKANAQEIRTSYYWYMPENQQKVRNIDNQVTTLENEKKGLFSTPALVKNKRCHEYLNNIKTTKKNSDDANDEKYSGVVTFIATTLKVIFFYLLAISFLYLAGYSLGWIYRGFKK